MELHFLEGESPLVKQFAMSKEGQLTKTAYPFVYAFTSHPENIETILEFAAAVERHAEDQHCLLKGVVNRPLVKESRAGSTSRADKTDWVCLDLDGVTGYSDLDSFLRDIGCGDTDYVCQWSASHGLPNSKGLRCHVFMLLNEPQTPEFLKRWLQTKNLKVPILREQLELTRTNLSLLWRLDITTCQNDKLLYIAPPIFKGMKDPMKQQQRIFAVEKTHRTLTLGRDDVAETAAIRNLTDVRINELRTARDMPKVKTAYKNAGSVEYAVCKETAVITDIKRERGFVYFNLAGGDSWAYYHPEKNPKFIYSFKGEPPHLTSELLPSYWEEVSASSIESNMDSAVERVYLAFRDFKTSCYYNGWFEKETSRLTLARAKSETQLKHFLKQHGVKEGDFIPDWDLVFDPSSEKIVDVEAKTINIYKPSAVMENRRPAKVSQLPPVCKRIIEHVLGADKKTFDHFINWLACIVQFKDRTGTAWVLSGTQGTGKGLLFHNIITPLFGENNVVAKRMEELEKEFTGFVENKLVTNIDEVEVGSSAYHAKITAKLKNLIVEPTISIRKMYADAYMARNFNNMIFSSNMPNPVHVSPDDRRHNIGVFQQEKLKISTAEVEDLLPKEIERLYAYLFHYPADRERARTALVSEARASLISLNRAAIDVVSDALLKGDLTFLFDQLPSEKPDDTGVLTPMYHKYSRYRKLLLRLFEGGTEALVSRDELLTIYEWCDSNTPTSPNKFTALLKHHRIDIIPVWNGVRTVRGVRIKWDVTPEWREQTQTLIDQALI